MKSKFVKWVAGPLGLVVLIVGVVTYIWPPGTIDAGKLAVLIGVTVLGSVLYTTVAWLPWVN